MHLDLSLNIGGPEIPDVHFEDLEEQDLRNLMAYLHGALSRAIQEGLDEAVIEVLTEWYDKVFIALAEASETFRERVLGGFVFPPGGPSVRQKYVALAREASES